MQTLRELDNRLAAAKAAGKPAMIDYYADWCTDCLRMEKATFAMPAVRAEMTGRFVLLQADVTDPNDPEVKAMKQRFGVFGPPAMLFFDASGARTPRPARLRLPRTGRVSRHAAPSQMNLMLKILFHFAADTEKICNTWVFYSVYSVISVAHFFIK